MIPLPHSGSVHDQAQDLVVVISIEIYTERLFIYYTYNCFCCCRFIQWIVRILLLLLSRWRSSCIDHWARYNLRMQAHRFIHLYNIMISITIYFSLFVWQKQDSRKGLHINLNIHISLYLGVLIKLTLIASFRSLFPLCLLFANKTIK